MLREWLYYYTFIQLVFRGVHLAIKKRKITIWPDFREEKSFLQPFIFGGVALYTTLNVKMNWKPLTVNFDSIWLTSGEELQFKQLIIANANTLKSSEVIILFVRGASVYAILQILHLFRIVYFDLQLCSRSEIKTIHSLQDNKIIRVRSSKKVQTRRNI